MEHFDGPFFTADLLGPDGKLSRLHKGGQLAAARATKKAAAAQTAASQEQLALTRQAVEAQTADMQATRDANAAMAQNVAGLGAPSAQAEYLTGKKRPGLGSGFGLTSAFGRTKLG